MCVFVCVVYVVRVCFGVLLSGFAFVCVCVCVALCGVLFACRFTCFLVVHVLFLSVVVVVVFFFKHVCLYVLVCVCLVWLCGCC